MLILTRGINDTTTITTPEGVDIHITVLGVNGQQVKIGFQAPKEVSILRDNAKDRDGAGVVRSTF